MPVIIKNGKVYGDRSVTLTQAEYNALSEVEKNNGTTYYIYDVNEVMKADDVALDNGTVEDLAGSVAVIETSPATAIHAVGSFILWNGQLYEVTAPIDVGETLTVGTNITAKTVGEELTTLKNGLTSIQTSSVTMNTNWTTTQNRVVKKTGFVELYVECLFSGTYTSGWNKICTIPAGYRPADTFDMVSLDNGVSGAPACDIKIERGGAVSVYSSTGLSKNLRIHAVYIQGN